MTDKPREQATTKIKKGFQPAENPPLEGATPRQVLPTAPPPREKHYRVTFLCANNEVANISDVSAINDLSIAVTCMAIVVAIQPKIASFRIINLETNENICDCGFLSAMSSMTPILSKALKQPIVHTMQLQKGDKLEEALENRLQTRPAKK